MRISVIGTGYVGLVSGVCLAEVGHHVICVDIDEAKIESINNGNPPIYEKDLCELLQKNIGKSLRATSDLQCAVADTEVSIIAVGTPFDGEVIDLSYVKTVASEIGHALRSKTDYHVVIVKSTVVPGTTDRVILPIIESASGKKAGKDFGVGMNPEFLREGEAIGDFMNPDRIVLGGLDDKTRSVMESIYEPFRGVDVVKTNNTTAEMIKYAANSLLATMISFSNEIGNLCATLGGIDVVEVMQGVHKDKRLSPIQQDGTRIRPGMLSYLEAGCGFGGSCFPKDVKALLSHGKQAGYTMSLLNSVIEINKKQPERVLALLNKHFPDCNGLRIAILGLAFKPGTDDMRESPAIPIVEILQKNGATLNAYDPVAGTEAKKIFGNHNILYYDNLADTIRDVDVIVLLTRWDEFKKVPGMIKDLDPQPLFIDGRRMLNKNDFQRYEGIGL
jgi:UDPglucose 6-dehydrogenase